MTRASALIGVLSVAVLAPMMLSAQARQACADTAGFVRFHGVDTLVVERVIATADSVSGVQLSRDGISRYVVRRAASGVTKARLDLWDIGIPMSMPPTQGGEFVLQGDSAVFQVRSGSRSQRQSDRATSSAYVMLDVATGLEEQLLRETPTDVKGSRDVPTFFVASGGYSPLARLTRVGADSIEAQIGEVAMSVHTRAGGRIERAYYRAKDGSTATAVRVDCATINRLVRSWQH